MGNFPSINGNQEFKSFSELFTEAEEGEKEKEIKHMRHHIIREVFGGNFSSPVQDALRTGWARVLEVDCGPGTWLFELSADYPGCSYIGTKTISIPSLVSRPFDVEFVEADVLKGLPYEDDTFDLVSMRFSVFDYNELNVVIKEMVRVLKPGGWLELCDPEYCIESVGPLAKNFCDKLSYALRNKDLNPSKVLRYAELMNSTTQLLNIQRESKSIPLGSHSGRLGESCAEFCQSTLTLILPKLANIIGIKPKDTERYAKELVEEATKYQSVLPIYRVFAQKEIVLDLTS